MAKTRAALVLHTSAALREETEMRSMTNDTTIAEALRDPVLGPEILRDCAEQFAAIAKAVLPAMRSLDALELLELQAECQAASINDIPLTALMRRYRAKQAALKPKRGAPRSLEPESEREVLEMVRKEIPYADIAEEKKVSVGTIKRIVQRYRRGEL